MITDVDPGKMLFLSVALSDGSMEAFKDINDAVAHASELVGNGEGERGIFVAVPRARVHMGVRVDAVDLPVMPVPIPEPNKPPEPSNGHEEWVKAQGLVVQPNGKDHI